MRQVTGRSSKNSTTKASIRLASGGRFFSQSTLGSITEEGSVVVTVDTIRVTLVPANMAQTLTAEQFLAINGQAPLSDEVAVLSPVVDDKVAVIAIAKSAFEALHTTLGDRLQITTPLLSTTHSTERAMVIEVVDSICYIRLYDNGLKIAEAIEVSSPDELLFYVANILKISGLTNIPIYINGPKDTAKRIKKYYKVICE